MRNRLKVIREDRGLTQEELADRMNTSKATVSRLENSRRRFGHDWITRAAAALDCHPAELFPDSSLDETELLKAYRGLPAPQRTLARRLIDALAVEKADEPAK